VNIILKHNIPTAYLYTIKIIYIIITRTAADCCAISPPPRASVCIYLELRWIIIIDVYNMYIGHGYYYIQYIYTRCTCYRRPAIDCNIIVGTYYYSLIPIRLPRVYDSAGGVRAACTHVWSIIISYRVSLFVLLRSSVVKPHIVFILKCVGYKLLSVGNILYWCALCRYMRYTYTMVSIYLSCCSPMPVHASIYYNIIILYYYNTAATHNAHARSVGVV